MSCVKSPRYVVKYTSFSTPCFVPKTKFLQNLGHLQLKVEWANTIRAGVCHVLFASYLSAI